MSMNLRAASPAASASVSASAAASAAERERVTGRFLSVVCYDTRHPGVFSRVDGKKVKRAVFKEGRDSGLLGGSSGADALAPKSGRVGGYVIAAAAAVASASVPASAASGCLSGKGGKGGKGAKGGKGGKGGKGAKGSKGGKGVSVPSFDPDSCVKAVLTDKDCKVTTMRYRTPVAGGAKISKSVGGVASSSSHVRVRVDVGARASRSIGAGVGVGVSKAGAAADAGAAAKEADADADAVQDPVTDAVSDAVNDPDDDTLNDDDAVPVDDTLRLLLVSTPGGSPEFVRSTSHKYGNGTTPLVDNPENVVPELPAVIDIVM